MDQAPAESVAEALFLEGRKLMAVGKTAEACARFAESRRIDPAIGTTMNLGRCYARLGRTASAWLLYREAAAAAHRAGQSDRERVARMELAALELELPRLVVQMEPALAQDPRIRVELDGTVLPKSGLGTEFPVDPGAHELRVRVEEKVLWSFRFHAKPRSTEAARVPELEIEEASPRAQVSAVRRPPPSTPREQSSPFALSPRRYTALGFAGGAVLGGAYAVLETVNAKSAYDRSNPGRCVEGGSCTDRERELRELSFDRARRADLAAGFSAACLLGAAVLWVFGAPPEQPKIGVGSLGSGIAVHYSDSW